MGVLGYNDFGKAPANAGVAVPRPLSGLGEPGTQYARSFSRPQVQLLGLPGGEQGTVVTLQKMRDAALGAEGAHNAEVRMLAQKIVSDVGSKDYVAEARAIFEFMRQHVRYTLDPRGLEWVQTPWYTLLVIGQGDCDDHATATIAMAVALGHGGAFRTYKGDKARPDEWSHVVPVIGVRQEGRELWLPCDSTERHARFGEDPPGAGPQIEQKTWVIVPA